MRPKPTTQFSSSAQNEGQPYVHPAVAASPEALAYKLGAQQRLQQRPAGLSKYTAERGGGASPGIPPLEQPHHEGMTMAAQAGMYGTNPEERVAQAAAAPNSIIDMGPQLTLGSMRNPEQPRQLTPQQMGILVTDLLPKEAQEDPSFMKGQGSMFAVNQPQLALRYGVVRNGIVIPAQALQANQGLEGQGKQGRRPLQETIRDMQAVASAQTPPKDLPKTEDEAEAQVAKSSAAASARAGQPLGVENEEERKKQVADAIDKLDDFDYDSLRRQMNTDAINNPEQRRIIEDRLQPLELEELILKDRVKQQVPIIPKKFEVSFLSMTGDDDLALKRLLMAESKSVEVTDRYLLDKFALMSLSMGCLAINGNPVPSHLNEKGEFDDEKFWLKFAWMLKRSIHVLAAIGANHTWFEIRVRKLLVTEKVGNG